MMLTAALLVVATTTDIERCRAADLAFDATAMIGACSAAADDPASDSLTRGEALRRLALGHQLNNDGASAEATLRRLLVLFPNATLTADLGPRLEELLARARQRLRREGSLAVDVDLVKHGAALTVRVLDRLGRVRRADLIGSGAAPVTLERADEAPGRIVFSGALPANLDAHEAVAVHLVAWDGSELEQHTVRAALEPARDAQLGADGSGALGGDPAAKLAHQEPGVATTTTGATALAVGAPLFLVGAALGAIASYELFLDRIPCTDGGRMCVPETVFFGMYQGIERERFLTTDGPALLLLGVGTASIGALLSAGGAWLLVAPPHDAAASGP